MYIFQIFTHVYINAHAIYYKGKYKLKCRNVINNEKSNIIVIKN